MVIFRWAFPATGSSASRRKTCPPWTPGITWSSRGPIIRYSKNNSQYCCIVVVKCVLSKWQINKKWVRKISLCMKNSAQKINLSLCMILFTISPFSWSCPREKCASGRNWCWPTGTVKWSRIQNKTGSLWPCCVVSLECQPMTSTNIFAGTLTSSAISASAGIGKVTN